MLWGFSPGQTEQIMYISNPWKQITDLTICSHCNEFICYINRSIICHECDGKSASTSNAIDHDDNHNHVRSVSKPFTDFCDTEVFLDCQRLKLKQSYIRSKFSDNALVDTIWNRSLDVGSIVYIHYVPFIITESADTYHSHNNNMEINNTFCIFNKGMYI